MKQPIVNAECDVKQNINHIFVGCTTLAPPEYTNRHYKMHGYTQWTICKHMGLQVTNNYCEYIPE
jgi:hypothetical protein